MGAAIEKRQPHPLDRLVSPDWTLEDLLLVKEQLCPKGIPDGEFYVFMRKCQATGLNPLVGEAFCVPRKVKNAEDKYVTRHVFEAAYEGMRARAGRFGDFVSVDGGTVCKDDPKAWIDKAAGEVQHVFDGRKTVQQRGGIVGAWGRVRKKDGTCVVTWLPSGARAAEGPVWKNDPGGHLEKCAKVAALRETYPVAFAAVYIREEMAEERTAERVAEIMSADAVPAKSTGPAVTWGPHKGTPFAVLTLEEAREVVSGHRAKCGESKAPWAVKLMAEANMLEQQKGLAPPALNADTTLGQRLEKTPEEAYAELEPTQAEVDAERAARDHASQSDVS